MSDPILRIVRLKGAGERPWMVNLYDEHDKLICVCGPYNAEERDACIRLFSGWTVAATNERPSEQPIPETTAEQVQQTITRSAAERSRLAELSATASRRVRYVGAYSPDGPHRTKLQTLLQREAARMAPLAEPVIMQVIS